MTQIHTAYDVMKEYLITGAELDGQFQIPMLPKVDFSAGKSIDFVSSKFRSLKGHNDLTVNFYIDDKSFLQVWNQPDQYIEHLKCFNSVCSPDFTIFRDAKCVEHIQPVQKPCFRILLGGYGR